MFTIKRSVVLLARNTLWIWLATSPERDLIVIERKRNNFKPRIIAFVGVVSECNLQMVRVGCLHPKNLPKTLRNGFDLEAKFLGIVRVHWATPLFTKIRKIIIPYPKDFCWLVGALKNWFNTLSSYNLVSNQSEKFYLIYLQKRDITRKNCRKIQNSCPKDFCWLVGAQNHSQEPG